jgi:SAM-dependent methyltransferase
MACLFVPLPRHVLGRLLDLLAFRGRTTAGLRDARASSTDASRRDAGASIDFICNICASACTLPIAMLEREAGPCAHCGSTVRARAIVHQLSLALFGESVPIRDFPSRGRHITGLGMTDADVYARLLAKRLAYRNTYLHREPKLDIQHPGAEMLGTCDFVTSSDVLEHVDPPVLDAFVNLRRLLKPGGVLVLTVPFAMEGPTLEHFPDLFDYRIEPQGQGYVLINRTRSGHEQRFEDPIFHGGPGNTVELRLFSKPALARTLAEAGFVGVTFHAEPCLARGIAWNGPWSVPITARAPS